MLKLLYKTSIGLVDYQQAFQTMEKAVANWLAYGLRAQTKRLPRECGGPVDYKFPEGVNNTITIGIDPFWESSFSWIPAFARKTLVEGHSAQQRREDCEGGVVWFLEHPALYTEGTSADPMELLDGHNLPVYRTNRGGKFTYHGPGQRVVYLVLDLKKLFAPEPPDAKRYVFFLEQVLIEVLKDLGLVGLRITGNPGIWVQTEGSLAPKKIAFIGIRIKKWISYHGLAFNISPNLEHFKGIIPCGVKEYGITSLKELKKEITTEEFDKRFKENFERLLKQGI